MKSTDIVARLLRKNTSTARIIGFALSNFLGLVIVCGALQFFLDAGSIWNADDSFISTDYLVVNKKVTSANTLKENDATFSDKEIEDIRRQPWSRNVGVFTTTNYEVRAKIQQGDKGMSTMMFFESIPDRFIDVAREDWYYKPGSTVVPIIIAKDYLTLYNFGFANSAGLPQLSEQLMSGMPLSLLLTSENGERQLHFTGQIVGYSNRLNTVLVPQDFMDYTNEILSNGNKENKQPSRIIIDTNSPGDVAITNYLEDNNLEVAGDKNASKASFFLKVITGILLTIGVVITLLSFFILLLSMSLLMEKNRDKLHSLLMLGYPLPTIAAPYKRMIIRASLCALLFTIAALVALHLFYAGSIEALGGSTGGVIWGSLTAVVITILLSILNIREINKKVYNSWRL